MNRLFKLSIVLVLSAAMLLSSFSAFAATDDELTLDIRLMQEFYSQPYHNGDISNGTKILSTFYQRPTEYDPDSIEQLMLMNNMTWETIICTHLLTMLHHTFRIPALSVRTFSSGEI